jgi:hypothetical protein
MESFAPPQALAQWPGRRGRREECVGVSFCLLPVFLVVLLYCEGLSGHQVMLIK